MISSGNAAEQTAFLDELSDNAIAALPWLWEFWAHPHQLPPERVSGTAPHTWRTWVIMGGRGAGKTRAGAEWVRNEVEGPRPLDAGSSRRVALIGETFDQARDVMVFGESGIMACCPPDRRPTWVATRRQLIWPNGAIAQIFSAQSPEALRGPQFDAAWGDEIGKWKKAGEVWDMLQFALRLGDAPKQVITTTPRNSDALRRVLAAPSTVVTQAPTEANRAYLAAPFLAEVRARYAGTRLAREELDGAMLEDVEGALWQRPSLEVSSVDKAPTLDRIVVAVDPPAGTDGDDCGIIVVGAQMQGPPRDWRAYVLADESVGAGTPLKWAQAACDAAQNYGADRLVAEVNQGGAMVESLIRQVDPMIAYRAVHASRGKVVRAEPIAALYEQGRVRHVKGLSTLEDQMCQMTIHGFTGSGSPDRVDALVWALWDVMIDPASKWVAPRVRRL